MAHINTLRASVGKEKQRGASVPSWAACDTMRAAKSDAGFVNCSATTRPFAETGPGERTAHQRTTRRQP